MVNNFLFLCVCVCVLLVTWRANGIVLYMYEGKVLMDMSILESKVGRCPIKLLSYCKQSS